MDLRLPLLADINLHLGVAEEALAEGDFLLMRSQLEKAEESLAEIEAEENDEALLRALLLPLIERASFLQEAVRVHRKVEV